MSSATPSGAPPRRRVLWLLVGLLGVLVILALVWTGLRAVLLSRELDAATTDAQALQSQLAGSDLESAAQSAQDLAVHARTAAELSADPVWRAVEYVPIIGANLRAARVVSSELDHLSVDVIAPALALEGDLSSVWSDGGLNLDTLSRASSVLDKAVVVVREAREQVKSADDWALVGPVRDGLAKFSDVLADAQPVIDGAALAVRATPTVVGEDGPRSILVMLQNGAELRTGGGLTGAFAELRADHGTLEIVDQASSSDFPKLDEPITALPASVSTLLDDKVGRYVMNISSPADFEVSAELASQWWEARSGHRPDTIISMDVNVLGALLTAVGPVQLDGWGELTSDNLVEKLLVEPYLTLDQSQQDELFQRAVSAVFTSALSSDIDANALLAELSTPISEGRVSIWSRDADVQSAVAKSPFAGAHARQLAAGDDAFAVYFNDVTGAKMDSFLDIALQSGVRACREDDLRDIAVAVTLTSTAPADAGSAFPASMTGDGRQGIPPGEIGTLVAVAAPEGTFIGGVTRDDTLVPSISGEADGLPVTQTQVVLTPGESATLVFHFVAAHPGDIEPQILHTPLLKSPEISKLSVDCQ